MKLKIGADASQAKQELDGLGKSMGGVSATTLALGGALVAVAVATAAAMKAAINYGDSLEKTSQKVGISVEALSSYRLGAELAGTSQDALVSGLQRLQKNMGTALRTPTSAAALAFKDLGVQFQNADGSLRDVEDILPEVSEKFAQMEDGTLKTSIAMELMGRSGAELIPFLNQGAQGLEDMRSESEALGVVWNTETAAAAAKFNDELTRTKTRMDGIIQTATQYWLPSLVSVAERLNEIMDTRSGLEVVRSMDAQADAMKRITVQQEKVAGLEETIRLNRKGAAEVGITYGSRSIHRYYDRELETAKEFLRKLEKELGVQAGIVEPPKPKAPPGPPKPDPLEKEKAKAQGAYDQLMASLRTEKEARVAALEEQVQAVEDANALKLISDEQAMEDRLAVIRRFVQEDAAIKAKAQEEADKVAREALEKENARLQKHYEEGAEMARQQQEERARLVEQEQAAQVDAAVAIMDGVSQLAGKINEMVAQTYGANSKEAKESARATFMIQQAMALGQAAVLGAVALQQAAASGPPPFNAPAIAAQAAIVGFNVATIMATTVAGVVADAGLPPGALRAAGFGEHTTVMMRRDEMILDRKGTSAISRMLEGGAAGGQPVTVNTTLEIDGRVLGHTVDNHLIRSKERGIGYADRIRYGTR
jgi:hypothetical protein